MTTVDLAVNGTLMRGLELNANMINAGATFVRETATAPTYRLWSIHDRHPAMIRVASGGRAIAVEVWAVPPEGLAKILLQEPPGLCIGTVRLADGEEVLGVLGEPALVEGQQEITDHGGWRAYIAAKEGTGRCPAAGVVCLTPSPAWRGEGPRYLRGDPMPPTGNIPALTETPPAPTPARRPATDRLVFPDALRGFALIFMVWNHTGRWWQDRSMGWPWYYSIYVTMAVAAPTFLFLVGFCLPLSLVKTRGAAMEHLLPTLSKYVKRGGRIILAGLLLNVLVFPEDPSWSQGIWHNLVSTQEPLWSNGVLQTIGLGIIIAAPVGLFVRSAVGRSLVVATSVLLYLSFWWTFDLLKEWVVVYPAAARVLFFEFPPWPWVALVLFGLVPGEMFVEQADRRDRSRYMVRMAWLGALCMAWLLFYDWWAQTPKPFTFMRDFSLNNHWTPRPPTAVWVIGMTFCFMALFYYLAEVLKLRMTWLVTLGQTALFLYFVHQLIVLTLVNQHLHLKFNNWWYFGAANLLLMALLLGLGRGWIEVKRIYRQRVPSLAVLRRA